MAFWKSLAGRMLRFGILPTGLVLTVVAIGIERGNTRAVLAGELMAQAQVQGVFGERGCAK